MLSTVRAQHQCAHTKMDGVRKIHNPTLALKDNVENEQKTRQSSVYTSIEKAREMFPGFHLLPFQ